ncbi:hypothetical protein [Pseudaestuariivita atlantica]|uniref:Peptidase S8/S53 domain-containing protein n=1 Tax=Pseudaestuariivita atlantica TaxID=1317121 RepID=A0A0L1JLX3_9RHOB|nr:hypothetical protein [Pseudaestuariivita atlantica]KNG92750.1 hypothetical protein ATO11_14830 [Pseudaestuariivita atlantica]
MSDAWHKAGTLGDKIGPYAHWWEDKEKPFLPDDIKGLNEFNISMGRPRSTLKFLGEMPSASQGPQVSNSLFQSGEAVPLPDAVANEKIPHDDWDFSKIEHRLPGDIPADTVIVGILDTGIALSHMGTNISPGKTRIISSWQQGAAMRWESVANLADDTTEYQQSEPWLPCGREVFSGEINAALEAFGDAQGVVDEEAFNRALRISSPDLIMGNRDLEMATAHGTHTLSLAAGMDHENTTREERERQRIIAVNLPAQFSHGSGGNFLPYFAVYGVDRILYLADALWLKNTPDPDSHAVRGYPIVINFSYGMMAGPKDGYHTIELALKNLFEDRKKQAKAGQTMSPVRIMMPVGNDNLLRGAASTVLAAEGTPFGLNNNLKARERITVPWRIQPADSTANFVEIWSEAKPCADFYAMLERVEVFVTPPGREKLRITDLSANAYSDLADYARVYVRHVAIDPNTGPTIHVQEAGTKNPNARFRLAILVCVAPTTLDLPDAPLAPAGEWTVEVKYDGPETVDFTLYIQSDQSAVVTSKTGKRSYFDHENYRSHMTEHHHDHREETGAVADTYSFDEDKCPEDNDNWYQYGPVQRRGTHNAISSLSDPEMIAIGSFDDSSGYPTSYSATTDGNPQLDYDSKSAREITAKYPKNNGRKFLTVSYPGENAPSLFGLLGAGSRDGSVIGSRGTSMSTALATREAANAFMEAEPQDYPHIGSQDWFRDLGRESELEQQVDNWGQDLKWPLACDEGVLKIGSGRLPDPRKKLVNRLGGTPYATEDELE